MTPFDFSGSRNDNFIVVDVTSSTVRFDGSLGAAMKEKKTNKTKYINKKHEQSDMQNIKC